jgi:hypothetical protein
MYDDSDPARVYNVKMVRAVKEHTCDECRRTIYPREQYESVSALYDSDRWFACKTCAHCVAAREWIIVVCSGFVHHVVGEELVDHFHEGYDTFPLARLAIGVQHKWRGITLEQAQRWAADAIARVPRKHRGAA